MTPKTAKMQQDITDYLRRTAQRGHEVRPAAIAGHLQHLSRRGRLEMLRWLQERHGALAQQVQALLPPLPDVVRGYTTAPAAYDGFGTEELAIVGHLDGKPLRQIEMEVQHAAWQRARYGSGLHPCLDEAEFQQVKTCPWFQALTPTQEQI